MESKLLTKDIIPISQICTDRGTLTTFMRSLQFDQELSDTIFSDIECVLTEDNLEIFDEITINNPTTMTKINNLLKVQNLSTFNKITVGDFLSNHHFSSQDISEYAELFKLMVDVAKVTYPNLVQNSDHSIIFCLI